MSVEASVTALRPGIWAYQQLPGGWFTNNAGWLTGSERTLLVDTLATEARSRRLLAAVHAHSDAQREALTLVVTHAHGDHANGAGQVARAGGRVLTSARAGAEIVNGPHTYPQLFVCSTWGDIAPPESTDVVAEPVRIDLGGRTAEILPVPGVAHTDGDLVVWAPADGVLFTGDLIFHGVTPLAAAGSVLGWLQALDWLAGFEATSLVPGHGPVCTPDTGIGQVTEYLSWLLEAAGKTEDPDFTVLERQARLRWAHWLDPERHAVNLRLAHAEVHGHAFDLFGSLGAMVQSAGGMIVLDI